MAKRENPYEVAFAAYLRHRRVPYVAIHESHRHSLGDGSIKNLDYLISLPGGMSWLIDVKGRQFPGGGKQKQYWKNWATQEDLRGLSAWEQLFGQGSCGLLVFAYLLTGEQSPVAVPELFCHAGQWYAFLGIRWYDYASAARVISPRWGTVALPATRFRELARPISEFLQPGRQVGDGIHSQSTVT
ncbi:MAG: HYExAFE family protein [Pirellulales bacterium]|nr:HYExAFE family protein [Pirellulales bacterium]